MQGDEQTSNNLFQLALNKDGVIRGNYYDGLMDTTTPVYGSVDKKSQRAAWTIGKKNDRVFETGEAFVGRRLPLSVVTSGTVASPPWSLTNGDLSNTRVVRGSDITSADVRRLGVAWTMRLTASSVYGTFAANPVTDTHAYLMSNLGEDRYASSSTGMVFGTNSAYPVRAVNGHNFINKAFGAMIDAIPNGEIQYETYIDFPPDPSTANDRTQALARGSAVVVPGRYR